VNDRLFRSYDDRVLAGVAGGLAEAWDADPTLLRLLWVLLAVVTGGLALVVYIVMAIVVPEGMPGETASVGGEPASASTSTSWIAPTDRRAARRAARAARRAERRAHPNTGAGIVIGGALVIVGGFFLLREWLPQFDADRFWPVILIALGLLIVVTALGRGREHGSATADGPSETPGSAG
jgi:phage shock protein C